MYFILVRYSSSMYEQVKDEKLKNVPKILNDHQPPSRRVENYPSIWGKRVEYC